MTFVVNAMKQEEKSTNMYSFLLDVNSEVLWRDIIKSTWLILLSISRYSNPKTEFGSLYVKVLYEGTPYEIVSSTSFSPKDLCMFFISLGMDVVDINSFLEQEKQTEEQSARIISLCKTTYKELLEQKRLEKIRQEEELQKKMLYWDRMLEKSKGAIAWILDKVRVLLESKKYVIPPTDQMWLDKQLDEIRKQKMWSNYEKIRTLMQDLFMSIYSLEDSRPRMLTEDGKPNYDWTKNPRPVDDSDPLFDWTKVSTAYLQKQVDTLEEVKYHTQFGWSVLWWRQKYATIPILPYFLFIKKDILSIFDNPAALIYSTYNLIIFLLIFLLCVLSFILVFNDLLYFEAQLPSIYISFVNIGRFAFLLYLGSFLRKRKTVSFLLSVCAIVVLVYFISLPIIKNSFAL